jgi:hypothetical protein
MGMYMVLDILYLYLVWHEIEHGPLEPHASSVPDPGGAE